MNSLFQNKGRGLQIILAALLCFAMIPAAAFAADVDVYAEGAYTDTDLVIYLYADINAEAILSFGVRVSYPGSLTYVSATKNEAEWYFGDGTTNHPYMDPQDDGSGVLIIGGKLKTTEPTEGVIGNRVLLGTVTFSHIIANPSKADFAGVAVTYGRGDGTGPYKNFVSTTGVVKDGITDGVSFSVEIWERGDANGDGDINNIDLGEVRRIILGRVPGVSYRTFADANADSTVTNVDMGEIRNIILGN